MRGIKGKEEEIVEEIERYKIEILDTTETKKNGRGLVKIHNGYWLLQLQVDVTERG